MAKKDDGLKECALEGCTNRFEPKGSGARAKRFCSRAHQQKHHITKGAKEYRAELDAKAELLTCLLPGCGRQFKAKKALDGRDLKFYCSRACKDKHVDIKSKAARAEDRALPTAETDELISEMHKRGFYVMKADASAQEERFDFDLQMFDGDTFRFAVVGDTHYCSKQQQHTHLSHFYHYAADQGIIDFFHTGDLFNGDGRQHKGQEFENFIHGEDEQLDYVESKYPKIEGCKTRIIGGSHDYSFFKTSGSDVIKRLAERRADMEYLGYAGAYVDLTPDVDMYLCHPDGGTAYALSYQAQKKVENFTPENKPRIVFFGHYHRAMYIPAYRNVETLLAPCFQSQTPFLKAKAIFPVIGAWIVEVVVNEDGLARFKPELFRYYVPIENDF